MNTTLMTISSGILFLFLILSLVDGIYFHLWKFRLQERDDSKFEHLTHTMRALLFIPTLILFYLFGATGLILWLGVAVLAADFIFEVLDILNERKSRATLGGLSSAEYLVHILLTTLRIAAFTLMFVALPLEAWHLQSSVTLQLPELSKFLAIQALPGAIFVSVLHVYLIFDPLLVSRVEKLCKVKYCRS